jgi:hypothetical protein
LDPEIWLSKSPVYALIAYFKTQNWHTRKTNKIMDNRLTLFPGGHNGPTEPSIHVPLKRKAEEHGSKQPHPVLRSPNHLPVTLKRGAPWGKYRRFVEEDQAGRAITAMDKDTVVAVKEHKVTDKDSLKALKPTKHIQLVNLLDIFMDHDILFLIYEDMDASHVSLGDIEGGMSGSLKENEIAAIAEQVRQPLQLKEIIHEQNPGHPWVGIYS